MNILLFRLLSLLLLVRILFTHQYVLILYWAALVTSIEFLNAREQYKDRAKTYTLLFFLYLLFITIIRTIGTSTDQRIVYTVNVFEHLLFALLVSFKMRLYLGLLSTFQNNKEMNKYWLAATLFNFIGFLNEVYQNLAKNKAPLIFDFGSRVDMLVNIVGSLLFVLIAYLYLRRRDKREGTLNSSTTGQWSATQR